MTVRDITVEHRSRSDKFYLFFLTDCHIGDAACNLDLLQRDIDFIKEHLDQCLVWIGGDVAPFICRKDGRFKKTSYASWVTDYHDVIQPQIDKVVELFSPIAPAIVGWHTGNHEEELHDRFERDVYMECARQTLSGQSKELWEYLVGWDAFYRMKFLRRKPHSPSWKVQNLLIYGHHGAGSSTRKYTSMTYLENIMSVYPADIVFMGHRHQMKDRAWKEHFAPGETAIERAYRLGLWTGTYLGDMPSKPGEVPRRTYEKRRHYPPAQAGTLPVVYTPGKHEIKPLYHHIDWMECLTGACLGPSFL